MLSVRFSSQRARLVDPMDEHVPPRRHPGDVARTAPPGSGCSRPRSPPRCPRRTPSRPGDRSPQRLPNARSTGLPGERSHACRSGRRGRSPSCGRAARAGADAPWQLVAHERHEVPVLVVGRDDVAQLPGPSHLARGAVGPADLLDGGHGGRTRAAPALDDQRPRSEVRCRRRESQPPAFPGLPRARGRTAPSRRDPGAGRHPSPSRRPLTPTSIATTTTAPSAPPSREERRSQAAWRQRLAQHGERALAVRVELGDQRARRRARGPRRGSPVRVDRRPRARPAEL